MTSLEIRNVLSVIPKDIMRNTIEEGGSSTSEPTSLVEVALTVLKTEGFGVKLYLGRKKDGNKLIIISDVGFVWFVLLQRKAHQSVP